MRTFLVLCVSLVASLGCSQSDGNMYTRYRSSALNANQRIHVASFDADESEAYNQENCRIVLKQLLKRPEVTVTYWCEKGRFQE